MELAVGGSMLAEILSQFDSLALPISDQPPGEARLTSARDQRVAGRSLCQVQSVL